MNRRGFITGLSVAGAAGAVPALALGMESRRGFTWATVCGNTSCAKPLRQFIDMADEIRAFNKQDKYGRPL